MQVFLLHGHIRYNIFREENLTSPITFKSGLYHLFNVYGGVVGPFRTWENEKLLIDVLVSPMGEYCVEFFTAVGVLAISSACFLALQGNWENSHHYTKFNPAGPVFCSAALPRRLHMRGKLRWPLSKSRCRRYRRRSSERKEGGEHNPVFPGQNDFRTRDLAPQST